MCPYIHENPLRAGFAKDLSDYSWNGFPGYLGSRKRGPCFTPDLVLGVGGETRGKFERMQLKELNQDSMILEDLRFGLFWGSEDLAQELRGKVIGEEHREKPQIRAFLQSRDVRNIAENVLIALGETNPATVFAAKERKKKMNRGVNDLYPRPTGAFYESGDRGNLWSRVYGNPGTHKRDGRFSGDAKKIDNQRK